MPTLQPLSNAVVAAGGTAVIAIPANPNGGIIQNPQDSADQNVPAEVLYVDPLNTPGYAPGDGWGTCFAIYPGQTWAAIPGQTSVTKMNAATSGHRVSGIWW